LYIAFFILSKDLGFSQGDSSVKKNVAKRGFSKTPNPRTIFGRNDQLARSSVEKIVHKIKVRNALGLHARPAAMIAKLLQGSKSQVSISYRQETVNARSIMSILMLGIKKNSQIILTVEGEDAEETLQNLTDAFENQFGEMDH
jgi:phosphocarrier protein